MSPRTDPLALLSLEARSLLACVRREPDVETILRAIAAGLNWERLLQIADAARVGGLVQRALDPLGEHVPTTVRQHLVSRVTAITARNLALADLATRVLARLSAADVPVLLLKGLAVAARTYGHLGRRESIDVDLLVPRQHIGRARDVLAAMGYPMCVRDTRLLACATPWVEHHYAFPVPDLHTTIEMHAEVCPWFFSVPLSTAALFDRSTLVPLGRIEVPTLCVEDQLLHLILHGTRDGWPELRRICDIAETITAHPDVDWSDLLARACALGTQRYVLSGLNLARVLLGAPVPATVGLAIEADRFASRLPGVIAPRLFGRCAPTLSWFRLWLHVTGRERLRDRVAYVLRGSIERSLMGIPLVFLPASSSHEPTRPSDVPRQDMPHARSYTCLGVPFSLRVPAQLDGADVMGCLPPGCIETDGQPHETSFVVTCEPGPEARYQLSGGSLPHAGALDRAAALDALEGALRFHVAVSATSVVFVHAGVVGWRGSAIVVPGRSGAGKSTLVEALVRAGAEYYSDEYAVLDHAGLVRPFPNPLSLVTPGSPIKTRVTAPALGGVVGVEPLRIGLVVDVRYVEGSDWHVTRMTPAGNVLAMLSHTVRARLAPDAVLGVLSRSVSGSAGWTGVRNRADQAAGRILELADRGTP